jgi:hypothetical protein
VGVAGTFKTRFHRVCSVGTRIGTLGLIIYSATHDPPKRNAENRRIYCRCRPRGRPPVGSNQVFRPAPGRTLAPCPPPMPGLRTGPQARYSSLLHHSLSDSLHSRRRFQMTAARPGYNGVQGLERTSARCESGTRLGDDPSLSGASRHPAGEDAADNGDG